MTMILISMHKGEEIIDLGDSVSSVVIVNFMCQLDWALGGPDISSNTILGGSARVFLDESNTRISRLSKADCSPSVDGTHLTHQGPEKNKKAG